jgi:hypothetical protein
MIVTTRKKQTQSHSSVTGHVGDEAGKARQWCVILKASMNSTLKIVRASDEELVVCMSYRLLHVFQTKTPQTVSLHRGAARALGG